MSTRAVYQPRSAKVNYIWNRGISTTISKAKAHLPQQAMTFSKAKIQLAPPYIYGDQQSESASGRHSHVEQSGVSTAISKAKAYLAPRYINRDQQSESTSGTAGHDVQQSDNTAGTAVYQQRAASESFSGRHSRVDQSGISTAISRTKAQRAQQAMTFSKATIQLEQRI